MVRAGSNCATGVDLSGYDVLARPFPDPVRDVTLVCPLGDTIGYHRITEVRLAQSSPPTTDVVVSREYFGGSGDLHKPQRELMLSSRLHVALNRAGIRGVTVEIARLGFA